MKSPPNGYYAMRVVVAAEYMQYAKEQAAQCGCLDAADYIQGILNTALGRDMAMTKAIRNLPPVQLPEFGDDDTDARY